MRTTEHTARKEHHCYYCERAILPGTRYKYNFSVFEGEACVTKGHLECWVLALTFKDWYEGIPHFPAWDEEDTDPEIWEKIQQILKVPAAESAA
jgi:hypothetical protein